MGPAGHAAACHHTRRPAHDRNTFSITARFRVVKTHNGWWRGAVPNGHVRVGIAVGRSIVNEIISSNCTPTSRSFRMPLAVCNAREHVGRTARFSERTLSTVIGVWRFWKKKKKKSQIDFTYPTITHAARVRETDRERESTDRASR